MRVPKRKQTTFAVTLTRQSIRIMRPIATSKYTVGLGNNQKRSATTLNLCLLWAQGNAKELYAEYVRADSALYHAMEHPKGTKVEDAYSAMTVAWDKIAGAYEQSRTENAENAA